MRLGFQYPSPFELVQHSRYPDPDWIVTVRRRGAKTVYSSISARAFFDENDPARFYVDHPGEIGIFARLHIALAGDRAHQELTAAEVAELIGDHP